MMALRIAPMPLTIAIRQAPMDWKTALIYSFYQNMLMAQHRQQFYSHRILLHPSRLISRSEFLVFR